MKDDFKQELTVLDPEFERQLEKTSERLRVYEEDVEADIAAFARAEVELEDPLSSFYLPEQSSTES